MGSTTRWAAIGGAVLAIGLAGCGDDGDGTAGLTCDVAIVGGGAGGLHTAFRLAPTLGAKVCLFEKEAQLGGRIKDVALDETQADAPRIGTGARRVMETQDVLFALATELGITMEKPNSTADLINSRGIFGFAKDDFVAAYPRMTPDNDPATDQETWLYDKLRKGPMRASVANFSDFRAYIQDVAGEEEFHFLRDMSRFRADFEYPLDARGYLDYLDEEWDVCCTPSYPVGGMSAFIRGMESKATMAGARIFKNEPVLEISKSGSGYRLVTGTHTVSAKKVVIAAPPVAVNKMEGDIVERLRALPQYQQIIEVKVVTITQWFSTPWWRQIVNPAATADNQVWRAWTNEHCLNFIEIPLEPYAQAQNVIRSVYDDDINCVEFWEHLAKSGTDKVNAEIKRGMEYLFNGNGVSMPATVTIPAPIKTYVQIWPAAWHWLRAGATFTNADIFNWAVEPLAGEGVSLVGEAYNPQRSGWSDAAYKSSIKLLMSGKLTTGMTSSPLLAKPWQPTGPMLRALRRTRAEGGH